MEECEARTEAVAQLRARLADLRRLERVAAAHAEPARLASLAQLQKDLVRTAELRQANDDLAYLLIDVLALRRLEDAHADSQREKTEKTKAFRAWRECAGGSQRVGEWESGRDVLTQS
ncbi:unnamed protein product [Effrenium voratum]|nr:unnamed protein product [Effrenium voratum]CAJ1446873.1 unnamed protein product [Effrenium voratum]